MRRRRRRNDYSYVPYTKPQPQPTHVKCNKCGYVGHESEFPKGRDFFQFPYIAGCPKCNNHQSPGNASIRMMPSNPHPFEYVRNKPEAGDALSEVMHNAVEAS